MSATGEHRPRRPVLIGNLRGRTVRSRVADRAVDQDLRLRAKVMHVHSLSGESWRASVEASAVGTQDSIEYARDASYQVHEAMEELRRITEPIDYREMRQGRR
jgi:hypothetical protein